MTERAAPTLGLIVPCFNEQDALPVTARRLREEIARLIERTKISPASAIYFVDDGSTDATWDVIARLAEDHAEVRGIRLSRNFGHQYAIYAGLMEAEGDALVSLDADLQDDIGVLEDMLDSFAEGRDIVYGIRDDRASDTAFKRRSALAHYWLLEKLGIETVRNHADYRLLSRRAVRFLSRYRETPLYLRGIVPLLGLPSSQVYYRRERRRAGLSKYRFSNMLGLSMHGLTSFSVVPLRLISAVGILVFAVSTMLGCWALWTALWGVETVPGWASTVIPIYLLGGLQLFFLGVVGEYVGRIYIESKKRPLYQVEQRCGAADNSDTAG